MKVSVIIPVYKAEKYIYQCVESIQKQTYKNIEIILVDDGSPDNSPAICDELATKDSRIKVLHKPNGGASDARNVGVKSATGDYVLFIDSDDFLANNNCMEDMINEAEKTPECEFIGFNISYYYPTTKKIIPWVAYNNYITTTHSPEETIYYLVSSGVFPISPCGKLIKRELIQEKIKFIKGTTSEDIPWFIELLANSKYCRFVNKHIYMYRKENSASVSSSFSLKKFYDLYNILENGVKNRITQWNKENNDILLSFWAYELCILKGMLGYCPNDTKAEWRKKLDNYNWLFKYTLNPKVKLVSKIYRYLGNRVTYFLLYQYIKTRMNA